VKDSRGGNVKTQLPEGKKKGVGEVYVFSDDVRVGLMNQHRRKESSPTRMKRGKGWECWEQKVFSEKKEKRKSEHIVKKKGNKK